MKTSFATTFRKIAANQRPMDLLQPNSKTVCEIHADGQPINANRIYVANPDSDDLDPRESISSLLASAPLKEKYERIRMELDAKKRIFLAKLKKLSGSSDCETEIAVTFSDGSQADYDYAIYERMLPGVEEAQANRWNFRYNDVFDKAGKVKEFLDKHKMEIETYFQTYEQVLSKSSFFRPVTGSQGEAFDPSRAETLEKSVKDDAFFAAGHSITIANGDSVNSYKALTSLRLKEIKRILSDPQLEKAFDALDKGLASNVALKTFRDAIAKHPDLLLELRDYEGFKRKVWYSFVAGAIDEFRTVVEDYKGRKKDLDNIMRKAKEELPRWREIVDIFNARFHAPFKVSIENQRDLVLNGAAPSLKFFYDDGEREIPCEKNNLLSILSKGELRAFGILQIVFQIEARKNGNDNLLIFDDIADSFDYKNKYAIIEYLADYLAEGRFKVIILTHNFDFYRTILLRLELRSNESSLMAIKASNGVITLKPADDIYDVFGRWLNKPTPRTLLAMVPFVRNLSGYLNADNGRHFLVLTHCLHFKSEERSCCGKIKATSHLLTDDILKLYHDFFPERDNFKIDVLRQSVDSCRYVDWLIAELSHIQDESSLPNFNEISLDNKVVLAIGIRLLAEKFVINQLQLDGQAYTEPNKDQTRDLIDKYRKRFSSRPGYGENCAILFKVAMMTPEQIHLNSFMYEPLVDMSVRELLKLYDEVSAWKVKL